MRVFGLIFIITQPLNNPLLEHGLFRTLEAQSISLQNIEPKRHNHTELNTDNSGMEPGVCEQGRWTPSNTAELAPLTE